MAIPRHRGESVTPELAYKGWRWETMRLELFTSKGPHYQPEAADALERANYYSDQLQFLTGVGVSQ